MKLETIDKIILWNKIIGSVCMFLFVIGIIYIVFFADDNVCIQMDNSTDIYIEPQDLEKFCFRTPKQAQEKQLELMNKYNLKEDQELNLNINFSLN